MKKTVSIIVIATMIVGLFAFTACTPGDVETPLTTYDIKATLDVDGMTVTAEESVNYVNETDSELSSVYFHLYPSAFREGAKYAPVADSHVSDAYPIGVDYGGITVSTVAVNGKSCEWSIGGEDQDVLMVNGLTLLPGDSVDIDMAFTLDLPLARHRFGYHNGIVNLGNWYPVACMYEDGAFRTDPYYSSGDPFYSGLADYTVSLTAPTGWNVAGTGSVSTSINGDQTTTTFTASGVRDFAMTASDKYTCLEEQTEKGVTVRYYYAQDQNAEAHLKTCVDAVNTFSELFGDYAYDSLSVALTPFLYGGMEYPQMVFVSNGLTGDLLEEAIIHEIAHQWWYAGVGNDQINDAWMDEGLAEYSTTLFYENNPDYGVDAKDRIADAMQSYVLFTEAYEEHIGGDTSMNRRLCDYFSQTDYSFHTYVKGSLLFDSVRHTVGDEEFFSALKTYYKTYCGKIASDEELIACFENVCDMSLKSFFESWINGTVGLY
ncbi:MAG: M1 family metallopeptidase [Clostridia bacterium]|nr:M1 family metallopeptidase [Clostridia bacterium]